MAENVMLNNIRAFEKDFALLSDPIQKVDALHRFCDLYVDSMVYTDLCLEKATLAKEILKEIDYPEGGALIILRVFVIAIGQKLTILKQSDTENKQ